MADDRSKKKTTAADKKPTRKPVKKPDPYIAFLDTEFNAFDYYDQNGGKQEIIEIGVVVMRSGKVLDGFRSFCALKNGHTLSRRAQELTGILPVDLETAPSFPEVIEQMNVFLDMYNPHYIYAYGPEDRTQLLKTASLYNIAKAELYYIYKIKDIMKDLADAIAVNSKKKTKLSLSLKDMCKLCGIDPEGMHDAYNDALYLGKCSDKILNNQMDPDKIRKLLADKTWLSGYRQARHFKEKRDELLLDDEQLRPIRYAIDRLIAEGQYHDYQLQAFWDDLMIVTGREPEYD